VSLLQSPDFSSLSFNQLKRVARVLYLAPKHCRLSRVPAASEGRCLRERIGRSRPSIGP
jgi:hypothetical protein